MSYAGVDYSDAYYRDRAQEKAARLADEIKRLKRQHRADLKRARVTIIRAIRAEMQKEFADTAWIDRVANWLSVRAAKEKR